MDNVECYIDKAGEYRWRVRSSNGNIRSVSSEGYKTEEDCIKCLLATDAAISNFLLYHFPTLDEREKKGFNYVQALKDCNFFECEDDEDTAG